MTFWEPAGPHSCNFPPDWRKVRQTRSEIPGTDRTWSVLAVCGGVSTMASKIEHSPNLYDNARSVLLFADAPSRRLALRELVETFGGRVVHATSIDAAIARLGSQVEIDAVIVDATNCAGEDFERLVGHLNASAEAGLHPSMVILPPELIDSAVAQGWHDNVALLCAPSVFDETAAIGALLAQRQVVLSDVNAEGATARLRQLSEEVGRIARVLATMSGDNHLTAFAQPRSDALPARRGSDTIIDAMQVRTMIRARRLRELYFAADLFADPAWDMLLDLMAARLEKRQVAVSSLCIAAAVPPTTALRWIKLLTDQDLLVRIADPTDGRRIFIELADSTAEGMMNYLAAAQRLAIFTP